MSLEIDPVLRRYCEAFSTPASESLLKVESSTHLKTTKPRDATDHIQGRLFSMLSHLVTPKCILEIGTFTAYATICLSEGLAPGGKIITIEKNERLVPLIKHHLSLSGISDVVDIKIGSALEILPQINEVIDLAFIDAQKREYADYYTLIIDKVRTGGLILVDNTIWKGKKLLSEQDHMTTAIHDFNTMIAKDPRVEVILLPYRDGVSIIRKK